METVQFAKFARNVQLASKKTHAVRERFSFHIINMAQNKEYRDQPLHLSLKLEFRHGKVDSFTRIIIEFNVKINISPG